MEIQKIIISKFNNLFNMYYVQQTNEVLQMKQRFLYLAVMLGLLLSSSFTALASDDKNTGDDPLRRSQIYEPNPFYQNTSYPMPFTPLSNPVNQPAISTGYYFVDSDDDAPDYWRPSVFVYDTNDEPGLWRRIVSGARILDPSFWTQNPDEGLRFFRNPAYPSDGNYFNGPTDSTDDAIAGPIPIGFNFYFNGLRFDSFYVSTNGVIALTNRRYFYDNAGNRTIPTGATTCYDPMSGDWFLRGRSGDGLTDPTPDNWGYQYVVLGNDRANPQGGIRARGGALGGPSAPGFIAGYRAHLIAPFWGDLHLSQFNKVTVMPEDYGKVYFKRTATADKLIIYFVNAAPKGPMNTPFGQFTAPTDGRFGESNYIAANAQVILDKRDSSITIVYERFDGVAVVGGRAVPSHVVFRYNTTVGVTGFARHVNYGQPGGPTYPWAGEYQQYTHYFMKMTDPNVSYPKNGLAIKFKQWKNTLRVVAIEYRVRKQQKEAIDFTEKIPANKVNNYELLAGHEQLGALQPVAIIQNLSNNIQGPQGVNFQPQQFNFFARFMIINLASDRKVYNAMVPVDSACLAYGWLDTLLENCVGDPSVKVQYVSVSVQNNVLTTTKLQFPGPNRYNGIPPYGFVQVYFPPFEPNPFTVNAIGRLKAFVIADPRNPKTQEGYGDTWGFDDTGTVRIFVMQQLDDFNDDVTSYHIAERTPMPSTLKWVNIDAEVASGDEVSYYPLPPRGEYPATNNKDFNFKNPDYTSFKLRSPVIRMNRLTLERQEPATSPGGDELRSFPINLLGRKGATISVGFQRATKQDSWDRGWSDNQLIGMEPRTVINGDVFSVWTQYGGSAANPPDEIAIEWALPSDDGITNICNIDEKRWRIHPRRGGEKPVTDMPAYSLYGAGGYLVGYLESDKDSALSRPSAPNLNGLRPNLFDDGIDFDYVKAFVPIPDTVINYKNEGAKYFRFRVKMYARNNKKCITCIPDDDDVCYVDNVKLLFPSEITDVELTSVKIIWPYTVAPASQAIKIPIRVKISNNTTLVAPTFLVTVMIYRPGEQLAVYKRTEQIPGWLPSYAGEISMPTFNARLYGPGQYRLLAFLTVPGGDLEPLNDTNYTDVDIRFGPYFAYDQPTNTRNDVPDQQFTGWPGRGLTLFGFAYGGTGNVYGPTSAYNYQYGVGYEGGNGSGQIAMRFTLYQQDTVYGYQAFFAEQNQSPDYIAFSIYTGNEQPTSVVAGSTLYTLRAWDSNGDSVAVGKYLTYVLNKPIILQSGTYWMTVAQLGETGFELGASKYRMGMRITSIYIPPPITSGGPVGGSGYHLMIEKAFRKFSPTLNLVNDNVFAYENTRGSGNWVQFMPTIGNPGYGHLHHFGISPSDNYTATLSRGTWVPLIRPYFGNRWYLTQPGEVDPVELLTFDGRARDAGIDLFWETSSELNNYGFYIERRVGTDNNTPFKDIGFVKGAGYSTTTNRYSFFDKDVVPNTVYQYRLRQVDNDGSNGNVTYSQIITIKYEGFGEFELYQNAPNPFSLSTTIPFVLPYESKVKLEVLDVYGNVVKTLVDDVLPAGEYNTILWDGTDASGNLAPSGNYIYRLTANGKTLTGIMTLVR
jgi:hypothetical protein